jgi:hypothetical protein
MRTHQEVQVGEEVRVFDMNGSRVGQPDGGWPGEVVKAGPKLVTIHYDGRDVVFRRGGGRTNDNYGHQSYKTPEEAEASARMHAAKSALRNLGIDVTQRCSLSVSQLEAMVAAAGTAES